MKRSLADSSTQAFLALVKAGLWEEELKELPYNKISFPKIYKLAQEQAVLGLVAAGLEHNLKIRELEDEALAFAGDTLILESTNKVMNDFIAKLVEMLNKESIYALLVKGQGVAQCYGKPLWRIPGDIDLLLDAENYERAKSILLPLATRVETEFSAIKHLGFIMDGGYEVELHGTLRSRLSARIDRVIDSVQEDTFKNRNIRVWQNGNIEVFIPAPGNDVIFLFTHLLQHFFIEGLGLRQICDWCRFLFTYHESIDMRLLGQRLSKMGLISEWCSFAALAVDWLGMPEAAMPFYSPDRRFKRKALHIMKFVLESGNLGHNKSKSPSKSYAGEKIRAIKRNVRILALHSKTFPLDSLRFFFHYIKVGIISTSKGE